MNKLSLILNPLAIFGVISLTYSAGLAETQNNNSSQPQFICQSQTTPPKTLAIINGQTETLITWYQEYLLPGESASEICQSVAKKLQKRYESQQPSLFAYEPIKNKNQWDVCLVTQKGQKCTETDSELLFSLNNDFKTPATCVLQNTFPDDCPPKIRTRGTILSVPGGQGYSPRWFTQFFQQR